jgi:hypothetical protein
VTTGRTNTSRRARVPSAGRLSQFRGFDVKVMAAMIQRAVDGLPFLLAADPGIDVASYAAEVVTAFDLATRASH